MSILSILYYISIVSSSTTRWNFINLITKHIGRRALNQVEEKLEDLKIMPLEYFTREIFYFTTYNFKISSTEFLKASSSPENVIYSGHLVLKYLSLDLLKKYRYSELTDSEETSLNEFYTLYCDIIRRVYKEVFVEIKYDNLVNISKNRYKFKLRRYIGREEFVKYVVKHFMYRFYKGGHYILPHYRFSILLSKVDKSNIKKYADFFNEYLINNHQKGIIEEVSEILAETMTIIKYYLLR